MVWTSFQLNVPQGLSTATQTISTGLQTLQTGLTALREQLRVQLLLLQNPDEPSVTALNAGIQAVVRAVNSLLGSLINDVGLYVLVIPLPKRGLARLLPEAPNEELGTDRVQFPTNVVPASVRTIEVFRQITDPDTILLGGNAYFARTVMESLFDAGDINRPRFQRTDSWAYATFIAGAVDITSAITLAGAFDRIFVRSSTLPSNRGAVSLVPTGFTARLSNEATRGVLTWEHVPATRVIENLDLARITATHIAVIQSTDWRIRLTSQITDLFPTTQLTRGMRGQFGAEVVDVFEYDGISSQWTDPTEIPAGTSRFYTLAFRTRSEPAVLGGAGSPTDHGFNSFPTPIEVHRLPRPTAQAGSRGRLPDWTRSGTLGQTIPVVGNLTDRLEELLNAFGRITQTASDRNSQYLNFLQRQIDQYTSRVATFAQLANDLVGLTEAAQALAGASARISSGQGPIANFLQDFLEGFNPQTGTNGSPSFPPFTSGLEFTCGIVVLAVGPDVTGIQTLLELFFGPPETNEIVEGVQSIEQAVAQVETAVLAQLQGTPQTNYNAFNSDMSPTSGPDASCDP
jgi:hypothetical protein